LCVIRDMPFCRKFCMNDTPLRNQKFPLNLVLLIHGIQLAEERCCQWGLFRSTGSGQSCESQVARWIFTCHVVTWVFVIFINFPVLCGLSPLPGCQRKRSTQRSPWTKSRCSVRSLRSRSPLQRVGARVSSQSVHMLDHKWESTY